jgi:hypothetical protein
MEKVPCPLCLNVHSFTPRYPKAICGKCAAGEITDLTGQPVAFCNIDFSGGFRSLHTINQEVVQKNDHLCLIQNVKCYADEARFGGIVIQTLI